LRHVNEQAEEAMGLQQFKKREEFLNDKIKKGWLYFTPYYEEIRPLLEVPEEIREPDTQLSRQLSLKRSKKKTTDMRSEISEEEARKLLVINALRKVKGNFKKKQGLGGLYGGGEFGRRQMLKQMKSKVATHVLNDYNSSLADPSSPLVKPKQQTDSKFKS